ncbi:hypothetical protein ABT160_30040 [Streptomyces sp. NPDC001941]|uniref:hypothetical protein n=1 Tax=Streptomyces sp. NPDC001941 TaxID=3154659 RepID=UPI003329D999
MLVDEGELERVRAVVRSWVLEWSDPDPWEVRMVVTTGDAGMAALYGPGVGSVPEVRYLVVLRGMFLKRGEDGGPDRSGEWAALFLNPVCMRVAGYTVRPLDAIPELRLEDLGPVHHLDGPGQFRGRGDA